MSGARRDGAKRKEEILDAALRCFAEHGVLGTGIEEIRRAAGASPSSMYHLFGGLSEITLALLLRIFGQLFSHLTERVAAASCAKEAVLALVDGHIEWIVAHPQEGRFMYQAMTLELGSEVREALQKKKAELLTPLASQMERYIRAGALPAWPALLLDVVLLGPSHEACRRYLGGAPLDPVWLRANLPKLAWNSIASTAMPWNDTKSI